jgi:hypothetical protein
MHGNPSEAPLHGVMAEFRTPEELLAAIAKAKAEGFTKLDAYTPYPIEKVLDALDLHHSKLPLLVLGASIFGAVAVFAFAYWATAIDYPLNIGGRPLNSWPAFIPATFEGAIFHGGLAAALGMILLSGLPRPYHPVFNVRRFVEHGSKDGYFLVVESDDPRFDAPAVRRLLEGLSPVEVNEVES